MSRKFASAPKIGVSEGLPIDPQYASIIELIKYYRGIGDNAKAAELLKTIPRNVETIPVLPSADQKLDSVSVTRIDQQDEKKNLSLLWDSTDNAVTVSTNHERHSSMDVRYESTNDSEMYHAASIGQALPLLQDGKPDILWRNYSSGLNYVWSVDGVMYIGGELLPSAPDVNWRIVNR